MDVNHLWAEPDYIYHHSYTMMSVAICNYIIIYNYTI